MNQEFQQKYELGYTKIGSGTKKIKSGQLKEGKKNIEKGIKEGIEKAIKIRPDPSILIESHIINANRVLKDYKNVEKLLDLKRLKKMNENQRTEDQSTLERNLKKFEKSLTQKRNIIRLDYKKLYNDKAIFLFSLKNKNASLKCFDTGIRIYPEYDKLRFNKEHYFRKKL